MLLDVLLVRRPDGSLEYLSLYREGDWLFSRYLGLHQHEGWVLKSHRRDRRVHDHLAPGLGRHWLSRPRLAKLRLRVGDGQVLDVWLEPGSWEPAR